MKPTVTGIDEFEKRSKSNYKSYLKYSDYKDYTARVDKKFFETSAPLQI